MSESEKSGHTNYIIIVIDFLLILILIIAIVFSIKVKPEYVEIPFEIEDFQDYQRSFVIERPQNDLEIWQNISSIQANKNSRLSVKSTIFYYKAEDTNSRMGMRVFVLGEFNSTEGYFSESIISMNIELKSANEHTSPGFLSTEMVVYNLEQHDFNTYPNSYIDYSGGFAHWWSEGIGYDQVGMESSVYWFIYDDGLQSQTLEISAVLTIGNIFNSYEMETSIEISLIGT
jgi:hypothetical protein